MRIRHLKFAVAAAGVVFLASAVAAQPAMAAGYPDAAFYTGGNLTGTEKVVDVGAVGQCFNLAQPAKSAVNVAAVDIDVFFNANCQTGAPGRSGDLRFALGSLHTANFPYAAVSYRVRTMGS